MTSITHKPLAALAVVVALALAGPVGTAGAHYGHRHGGHGQNSGFGGHHHHQGGSGGGRGFGGGR